MIIDSSLIQYILSNSPSFPSSPVLQIQSPSHSSSEKIRLPMGDNQTGQNKVSIIQWKSSDIEAGQDNQIGKEKYPE